MHSWAFVFTFLLRLLAAAVLCAPPAQAAPPQGRADVHRPTGHQRHREALQELSRTALLNL